MIRKLDNSNIKLTINKETIMMCQDIEQAHYYITYLYFSNKWNLTKYRKCVRNLVLNDKTPLYFINIDGINVYNDDYYGFSFTLNYDKVLKFDDYSWIHFIYVYESFMLKKKHLLWSESLRDFYYHNDLGDCEDDFVVSGKKLNMLIKGNDEMRKYIRSLFGKISRIKRENNLD